MSNTFFPRYLTIDFVIDSMHIILNEETFNEKFLLTIHM